MIPNADRLMSDLIFSEEERGIAALHEVEELAHKNLVEPSFIPPLLVVLESGPAESRQMASWVLGKMAQSGVGEGSELDQLVRSLSDDDEEVRENAAWALGELAGHNFGNIEELRPLIALLEDGTATVRGMSAWALGRLAQRMSLVNESSLAPLERLSMEKSLYVSKGAEFALQRVKERL